MTIRKLPPTRCRLRAWTAAALTIGVVACGGPSDSLRTYDLVRILPRGDLFQENLLVDVGTEAARSAITGFSWNETAGDGTSFAWSNGPTSTVHLTLCDPQASELRLRGFPWPGLRELDRPQQTVEVRLNDGSPQHLEMSGDVEELTLMADVQTLRAGRNTVSLSYGQIRVPDGTGGDQRALGVAWDLVQLAPVDGKKEDSTSGEPTRLPFTDLLRDRLMLPPRTGVEYRLELSTGSRLELDRVAGKGPLIVGSSPAGVEPSSKVHRMSPGRNLQLELAPGGDSSTLLTLCNPTDEQLVLHRPRIELTRSM